jgi:hypothetical protein
VDEAETIFDLKKIIAQENGIPVSSINIIYSKGKDFNLRESQVIAKTDIDRVAIEYNVRYDDTHCNGTAVMSADFKKHKEIVD